METKRKLLPDVVKGFAVIMVILGHCIQELYGADYSGNMLYFQNELYQFVYSFHMPLFMLISGYFAYNGMGSPQKCVKRILKCLVPVFVFTGLDFLRLYIEASVKKVDFPYDGIGSFFHVAYYDNLWFLWAVSVCYLVVYLIHTLFKDNLIVYVVLFISLFFIPDDYNLFMYKFMLPFFVAGYFWNRFFKYFTKFYKESLRRKILCLAVLGAVFAILVPIYNEKVFIYVSGYNIFNATWYKMVACDMYRMIVGFVGSAFFICLFDVLLKARENPPAVFTVLSKLGKLSMEIYILQGYIILLVLKRFTDRYPGKWWLVPAGTVVTTVVSYFLGALYQRLRRCTNGKSGT